MKTAGFARDTKFVFIVRAAAVLLSFAVAAVLQQAPPLPVKISPDGLRLDYVTAADAHGAKLPNLRRFLKEGAYAEGATGSFRP